MSIEEIMQLLILITFTISFIWIVVFLFKKTLKNQRNIERKIKRILNIPQHPLEVFINQEQIDNDQIETEKEELLINVQNSR
jgi:cbb3-type cytochrome oxidase subunit 3